MMINYWKCDFKNAYERNFGTDDEPDLRWIYWCDHPDNETGLCELDNKWCEVDDDCKLLDQKI